MNKIAILASGEGTNAENIYKFFANGNRVRVDLVIYDRRNAGVAARMQKYGIETVYLPREVWTDRPSEIVEMLKDRDIDLIVLAGFLRYVPAEITHAFEGRILNIHPSLLPAYGGPGMYGENVHKAVIAAGEKKSGATVHYVSDVMDGGEIIMQQEVLVSPDDTPETLQAKIHKVEYSLYPRAITWALRRLPAKVSDIKDSENCGNQANPENTVDTAGPESSASQVSPDQEWAETLGVSYDPAKVARVAPPQIPGVTPPPLGDPGESPAASHAAGAAPEPTAIPRNQTQDYPKMPESYLVWAVVMTVLCCLPAGIVAIIFSSQVSSKYYAGDYDGAVKASERAQIWIIVSFVLGVMANTLYVPLSLFF